MFPAKVDVTDHSATNRDGRTGKEDAMLLNIDGVFRGVELDLLMGLCRCKNIGLQAAFAYTYTEL